MMTKEPPSNTSFRGRVAPAEAIEGNPPGMAGMRTAFIAFIAFSVQALTLGE
jgi:hypothetical protein